MDGLKAKLADPGSSAARLVSTCERVESQPGDFTSDTWSWGYGGAACAIAYQLTGTATYAASGLKLFGALLDDKGAIGDGQGGDEVVRRDTGYDIRIFPPYAAMIYDWLHDAPGMDAGLRQKALGRFKAWIDWYTDGGYLNHMPGANYHAGYVYAKSMVAVAAAGEDGTTSDAYWADVNDVVFGTDIVGDGLKPGGAIDGGDWPEGWQYGPLSVMEYALSARALEEQGASLPQLRAWLGQVALSYLYAVPPAKDGLFTNGDLDWDEPVARLNPRPLLGVIAGFAADEPASWARHLLDSSVELGEENPVFEALAEARGIAPVDFESTDPPHWYLAGGARKLFVRSAWSPDAMWAVFTSPPRLVDDHQHADASNFVLSRGADHLIVDPTPYGSLSSLTANALTVDSNNVGDDFKPGQAVWRNRAEMPWARVTESGIAAARAELSLAFTGHDDQTDVPFARRDWVFLPEGDVVIVDRSRTDDPARALHVRLRTPATLATDASARGTVGASTLLIRAVALSGGAPALRDLQPGDCDSSPTWGQCDSARFAVSEYSVAVPGPTSLAVHALHAFATGEPDPTAISVNDGAISSDANPQVVGASVQRGTVRTHVVASSAKDGVAGATLAYSVPGDGGSRHVVFDAPEDSSGHSTVTSTTAGDHCSISITAGGPLAGHPLIFGLGSAAGGCTVTDDATAPPAGGDLDGGTPPPAGSGGSAAGGGSGASGGSNASGGSGGTSDAGPGAAPAGSGDDGGCGCRTEGAPATSGAAALLVVAAGLLARRRRRS